MKPLELVTARTSAGCAYRLYTVPEGVTDTPRLVWSNRAYADVPASHQGAQERARAFARKEGYRIIDRTSERNRRAS